MIAFFIAGYSEDDFVLLHDMAPHGTARDDVGGDSTFTLISDDFLIITKTAISRSKNLNIILYHFTPSHPHSSLTPSSFM
jgi:hypothetical protein